jgi:hypothetical protein
LDAVGLPLRNTCLVRLRRYAYGVRNLRHYEPVGYNAAAETFPDLLSSTRRRITGASRSGAFVGATFVPMRNSAPVASALTLQKLVREAVRQAESHAHGVRTHLVLRRRHVGRHRLIFRIRTYA